MLVDEIAPRLRSVIPHCVKTVGAEDSEELVLDAIYTAGRAVIARARTGRGPSFIYVNNRLGVIWHDQNELQ